VKGPVFLAIFVFGGLGVTLWLYGHGKRPVAWLLGATSFLLVAAVPAWRNALASLTATPKGVAILAAVAVVGLLAFILEGVLAHKHHPVRTPVVAVVFGTAAALAIGNSTRILRQLAHAPAGTGHALTTTMHQIQSGHAAHAARTGAGLHGSAVLVIAVVALLILIVVAVKIENRRPRRPAVSAARKGGIARALGAGGKTSGGFPPASRPSLPAGQKAK
jgi:hypothetical protein